MTHSARSTVILSVALLLGVTALGFTSLVQHWMGRQPDGSFILSTGQHIKAGSIAFAGRPSDADLHPDGKTLAVLSKRSLMVIREGKMVGELNHPKDVEPAFHGLLWSRDGSRLYAAFANGEIGIYALVGDVPTRLDSIKPGASSQNPRPAGMSWSAEGHLMVALTDENAIAEVDVATKAVIRRFPVQTLPFTAQVTPDGRRIIATNWGGRMPKSGDLTAQSGGQPIVVDERGVPASGTVSIIDLTDGRTRHVPVGIHPTQIAFWQGHAIVTNSMSDTLSLIDLDKATVVREIPLEWDGVRAIGRMPTSIQVVNNTAYLALGGDNALAQVDLVSGKLQGFRPAGYYPIQVELSGDRAYVLNSKGNGSVAKTNLGKVGNAHDFEGTVSILDLSKDLKADSAIVAENNGWKRSRTKPKLKVYNGGIKHVLYIIKENRTYDEVFGDMPQGNGDPSLCSIGEKMMPNHHKLAREFTLFDNGYVSGTNSADGHAWSTQSIANDYLERFYVGYRTYPDDGDCAMSISTGGCLWDAAAKVNRRIRVYGEFCDDRLSKYEPREPKDWFELWEDRRSGRNLFKLTTDTRVAGLRPYICPSVQYWPLLQSDQSRADAFIDEYKTFSRQGNVPDLMILCLPNDHTEGMDPRYPTPRAMMADNDLALGRVVEAVSKSPEWKETCIFVIEDDAQSGPDHVDGHRTVYMAISPYNRRGNVDSTLYTTTNMIRSIELMLGIEPMNRFDAYARPIDTCFTETPDLTPYRAVPNNVPLDERNPSGNAMTAEQKKWAAISTSLDWSHIDGPDSYWLNRVVWYSLHDGKRPYPDHLRSTTIGEED